MHICMYVGREVSMYMHSVNLKQVVLPPFLNQHDYHPKSNRYGNNHCKDEKCDSHNNNQTNVIRFHWWRRILQASISHKHEKKRICFDTLNALFSFMTSIEECITPEQIIKYLCGFHFLQQRANIIKGKSGYYGTDAVFCYQIFIRLCLYDGVSCSPVFNVAYQLISRVCCITRNVGYIYSLSRHLFNTVHYGCTNKSPLEVTLALTSDEHSYTWTYARKYRRLWWSLWKKQK